MGFVNVLKRSKPNMHGFLLLKCGESRLMHSGNWHAFIRSFMCVLHDDLAKITSKDLFPS